MIIGMNYQVMSLELWYWIGKELHIFVVNDFELYRNKFLFQCFSYKLILGFIDLGCNPQGERL